VNFGNGAVTGTFFVDVGRPGFDPVTETFDVTGGQVGNGFDGSLTRTSCPVAATCTSVSSFCGAFFGPTGENVAAIGVIDEREFLSDGGEPCDAKADGVFAFTGIMR
jgi:hypothetical protein